MCLYRTSTRTSTRKLALLASLLIILLLGFMPTKVLKKALLRKPETPTETLVLKRCSNPYHGSNLFDNT